MAEKQCIFCNREKIASDILYQKNNFFTKVGFGLVGPGHSMLISNLHIRCFGELPKSLDEEFEAAKRNLSGKVEREFNAPTLIEYGVWGQSVPHAHTHFIPRKGPGYEVESFIEEMVKPGKVEIEEVEGINRIREIYQSEGSYVSIEEHGKIYVCKSSNQPPINRDDPNPYLGYRGFFAKKGLSVKNWKEMTEKEKERDEENRSLTRVLSK